ncbi:7tm 6 domain containing protein, partial [Asbolus verrucosus]
MLLVIGFFAVLFWSVFPVMDNSIADYPLPYLVWYPYHTKTSPLYELAYAYQILCTFFTSMTSICIDTLIASLNMYVGAQFDLLYDNLRNLRDEEDINKKLISCIKHHKEVLNFAASCNKFFIWILFLQFSMSAISLGLTIFRFTVVNSQTIGSAVFVEIFMYCWFGNEVEIK